MIHLLSIKCYKRLLLMLAVITMLILYVSINYQINNHNLQDLKTDSLISSIDYSSIKAKQTICTATSDNLKFDCFPRGTVDQKSCEQRNCCWYPKNDSVFNVPSCYYPNNYSNYNLVNVTESSRGILAFYNLTSSSSYINDVKLLRLDVSFLSMEKLRIKISDANSDRYEPPYPKIPIINLNSNEHTTTEFTVQIDKNNMGFAVVRKKDGVILFDSRNLGGFIFSDQFIQMSALLPTKYIYGMGEQRANLILDMNWKTYTLFSHDSIPTNGVNGYGVHPFYLCMEKSGNSHGVFLMNSNAMDVILQPTPAITYRVIGGILDFYYFIGPTPSDVIAQYVETIGRPGLPPYWSLGFHLCRFGQTFTQLIELHNRTIEAGIPWDTHWNDIDYMKKRNDFTLSDDYIKLPDYVKYLHEIGMHNVIILDPGISAHQPPGSYPPFDDGLKKDIFIKNPRGHPLEGKVWNKDGGTVFPDFTNPKTVTYWTEQISNFHSLVPFDGLWIDMNEPSNFINGDLEGCAYNDSFLWEHPQYVPNVQGGVLNYQTICMSAIHYSGRHYDLHNVHSLAQAIATEYALEIVRNLRPLVISRSSFPGLGKFSGHWSGDVYSTWEDMKQSITDLIVFNMFGIPLVGADICGNNGNVTVELCSRWSQLGAFYPFSRNHNSDDTIDQDPAALGPIVVKSARKALMIRYSLLPYLYSLFWKAHIQGETVVRPLFFEYPLDENTYNVDEQFLWGPALLISPVLKEKKLEVNVYLPSGLWYNYYSKEKITSDGEIITIAAPFDTIPLILRGGYIIPTQEPATTTTLSRKNPFGLLVSPDNIQQALGYLYWDDGESLNSYEKSMYNEVHFIYRNAKLQSEIIKKNYLNEKIILNTITVFGIQDKPQTVRLNGFSWMNFSYNENEKVLYFQSLNLDLLTSFNITWV